LQASQNTNIQTCLQIKKIVTFEKERILFSTVTKNDPNTENTKVVVLDQ